MHEGLSLLIDEAGFFTRQEARELGFGDRDVTRAMRCGWWHRIRRGFYTFAREWERCSAVERHRVRAHCVQRSLGDCVALSHASAVLEYSDLPTWGLDLSRVHVTRLDGGAGRVESDVVHHEGFLLDNDIVRSQHGWVVAPRRCVLEAGSRATPEVGLVLCNALVHAGLATREQLDWEFQSLQFWPWMRSMRVPLMLCDGKYESVGESRGLWLMWSARLPMPEAQHRVYEGDELVAVTDWNWPRHRALGEFDGRMKYGRSLVAGMTPGDVVFAEKQREDRLRRLTGKTVVRLIWSDLERPRITAARVREQLGITRGG